MTARKTKINYNPLFLSPSDGKYVGAYCYWSNFMPLTTLINPFQEIHQKERDPRNAFYEKFLSQVLKYLSSVHKILPSLLQIIASYTWRGRLYVYILYLILCLQRIGWWRRDVQQLLLSARWQHLLSQCGANPSQLSRCEIKTQCHTNRTLPDDNACNKFEVYVPWE